MFFVSLLLNQMVSWMRRQEGTTSLKALLYMDEIFGYFPPNANPPSKQPMLTLLKQARSFGIGVILSTQNPVDIDYKGLSNIGTWFIGRLQTKQDKEKVIDGLSSANESNLNKDEIMDLLSNLEKRNFILKNINEDGIKIFQTRWALSYLKGPIPRDGIKKLMADKLALMQLTQELKKENKPLGHIDVEKGVSKPIITTNLEEKYKYTSQNNSYYMQPYLGFSSTIHFVNSTKGIDLETTEAFKIYLDENMKEINFEEKEEFDSNSFETKERPHSSYYEVPAFVQSEKELKSIEKEFADFVYRNTKLTLYKNDALKISSKQDESLSDFKIRLQDRLNEKIDLEVEKLQAKFQKENDSIENKLSKLYEKLEREQQQASTTTTDTLISIGTSLLGAFFGKSSSASTIGKVASSARGAGKILKEKNDVKYVENEINQLQEQRENLKNTLMEEIEKINTSNQSSNYQIEEIFIKPKRSDIYNIKLELLWIEQ